MTEESAPISVLIRLQGAIFSGKDIQYSPEKDRAFRSKSPGNGLRPIFAMGSRNCADCRNGLIPAVNKRNRYIFMFKKTYIPWIVTLGMMLGFIAFSPAFAATSASVGVSGSGGGWGVSASAGAHGGPMMGPGPARIPGVFGTVTAISGTSLTVTQKFMRPNAPSSTTPAVYTVDASNAQVMKNGASSTVSAIATGDTVMVQGTVNGTSVTATIIRDGVMPGARLMGARFGHGMASSTSSTPPIQGNGEPVIAGSISAVNGTTLTVTNTSNVTYTVDVSGAKIVKAGATIAVANLAAGDSVVIQGTVNGTSVTASSVIDQGSNTAGAGASGTGSHPGIFGAIGNFFKHLFGF